jgi:hypothetical protein
MFCQSKINTNDICNIKCFIPCFANCGNLININSYSGKNNKNLPKRNNIISCQKCQFSYCMRCKFSHGKYGKCTDDRELIQYIMSENGKRCPHCGIWIIRSGGCDEMQCGRCYREFDWLYDDNGKRVGLAEYDSNDFSKNSVLWYRDNPWSALLQEDWKSKEKTLWSMMSNEAYQDCLEDDFETVIERTKNGPYCLIFPNDVLKAKKTELPVLFLDDSFILYDFPLNSRIWNLVTPPVQEQGLQSDASAEAPEEEQSPPHPDQEPQTEQPEQETEQEH